MTRETPTAETEETAYVMMLEREHSHTPLFSRTEGMFPRERSHEDCQTARFLKMSPERLIFPVLKPLSNDLNLLRRFDPGFNLCIRCGRWFVFFWFKKKKRQEYHTI